MSDDTSPSETEPFGAASSNPTLTYTDKQEPLPYPSLSEDDLKEFGEAAAHLIQTAKAFGVVIRIDTVPNKPLAMGNYEMVAEVYRRFRR